MEHTKQVTNRIGKIWNNMGRGKRMGIVVLFLTFIIAVVSYYVFFGRPVYVPVFSSLSMDDSANIVKKLDELKITDYKIEDSGATILVREGQVDRLRLDLAMDGLLPNSGKGFEIFDDAGFAITDEDRKIMYQRALEGELARSIMSLQEIEFARVHLALPQESVFSRETKLGNATVVVRINPLSSLEHQQIEGIIALVSGALRDIPEENVRVVDSNANLLSTGIFMEDAGMPASALTDRRMSMEYQFEKDIEAGLQTMLEQALGVDKVIVKVNAEMDFDSEEVTIVEYDDQNVLRSQQDHLVRSEASNTDAGSSPIDNNLQYSIADPEVAEADESISNYETVRNYEVGETRTHKIKAPGEVRRISTSVVYDGTLDDAHKLAISNIIMAAVGYDADRGDIISVEGLPFDKTYQNGLIAEMQEQETAFLESSAKRQKLMLYGGIAGGFVLLLLMIAAAFVAAKGRRKGNFRERLDMSIEDPLPIEDVIDDATYRLQPMEDPEIEKGVKEYADQHPEKLAELVKTWILKDEV